MASNILIVDDEKSVRKALGMVLEGKYSTITAKDGSEALKLFREEQPDLILLDIRLPDIDGMDVLKRIKHKDSDAIVIMVTAVEEVKMIVEAIKLGAYDYLLKPIDTKELLLTVKNALENKSLKEQIQVMQQPDIDRYNLKIIGQSPEVKKTIEIARKVSKSRDTTVLIVGESGSGKGVLARVIHYNQKNPGPFVTVNCGAIAKDLVESELFGYERGAFTGARAEGQKGKFEMAAGGTLFLDDIGAMPLSVQSKLLGVLEDRIFYRVGGTKEIEVSSRIIVATNTDLEKAVEQGLFRRDLFYRLNVVKINIPSLSERKDDIMPFTEHFIDQYNRKFGKQFVKISSEARTAMLRYSWPGNVRELRNMVERIILLEDADTLLPEYLYFNTDPGEQHDHSFNLDFSSGSLDYEKVTRSLINEALKRTRGNVVEAAQLLNIPVHKLRYRIKKFGLKN